MIDQKIKTNEIYREQEFSFIDECSEWIARDYYGNDLESLLNVFVELRFTVDEWIARAKENGIEIPKHWTEEQPAARSVLKKGPSVVDNLWITLRRP